MAKSRLPIAPTTPQPEPPAGLFSGLLYFDSGSGGRRFRLPFEMQLPGDSVTGFETYAFLSVFDTECKPHMPGSMRCTRLVLSTLYTEAFYKPDSLRTVSVFITGAAPSVIAPYASKTKVHITRPTNIGRQGMFKLPYWLGEADVETNDEYGPEPSISGLAAIVRATAFCGGLLNAFAAAAANVVMAGISSYKLGEVVIEGKAYQERRWDTDGWIIRPVAGEPAFVEIVED